MDLEREWWGMREWERKTGYVCERERVIEGERSREREIVDSEMISYLSVGWWPCIGFCTRIFPFGWLSISMSAYMYVLVSVSVGLHSNVCVFVCVCVCEFPCWWLCWSIDIYLSQKLKNLVNKKSFLPPFSVMSFSVSVGTLPLIPIIYLTICQNIDWCKLMYTLCQQKLKSIFVSVLTRPFTVRAPVTQYVKRAAVHLCHGDQRETAVSTRIVQA